MLRIKLYIPIFQLLRETRIDKTDNFDKIFLETFFLLSFRLFTNQMSYFYFRFITFFRNFSKSKVLSIRYCQFCSVKLKLFPQQIADPRSMFCFSECSFWNREPLAFRISGYSVGNPSSDWKFQCEISNAKRGHSFWLYLLQNRVYTALTLLLYKPWLYFCVLTQHAAAVQSRRRLSKSQVPASLLSELKFRAGPPMIVSAPGCK